MRTDRAVRRKWQGDMTEPSWTTPEIVDLTHTIAPGMPHYPGTAPPEFSRPFTIAEHGFAEQRVSLLTHTGTHLDTPAHMLPDGATLDAYPADRLIGRAAVADAALSADGRIELPELQAQLPDLASLDFVLLCTDWSDRWSESSYYEGYPVLTPAAARWLADGGLRGIGIDAVSIDAAGAPRLPIHRILLRRGLVIVENLTGLRPLVGRRLVFCCLPLKIAAADGAPARAVAWLA